MIAKRIALGIILMAIIAAAGGCGRRNEILPNVPVDSNLVVNSSFTQWHGNIPAGWEIQHFEGNGTKENLYGKAVDPKESGNFWFYERSVYNTDRWMALVQKHPVIPGYRLSFSADMKSEGLNRDKNQEDRANVYVRFYDGSGKRVNDRYFADAWTPRLIGTTEWRRLERLIDIPKNARTVEIGVINSMSGNLYVDNVALKVVRPVPWQEAKTKYVNFYYLDGHPLPPGAMEEEANFVESCAKKLGVKVKDKISYYYYPSEDTFRTIVGIKRGHERAIWKKRELHTTDPADRHEIVHMLLADLGYPPFGLAEGAIFYCLGSWDGRNLHMMAKQELIQKRLPALFMILKQTDMDKLGMSVAVPGWASFSMWLIDRYGIKKFMELYVKSDTIEEPGTFNSVFKAVYGEDFDVMDRAWRLWVLRYQPK